MAVNVHLVPVTGLTLPMISMGGSSIWFTSIAIGIVLSVSRYVDEMEGEKKGKKAAREAAGEEEEEPEEEEYEEIAKEALQGKKNKRGNNNNPIPAV